MTCADVLPRWERLLYWVTGLSCLLYCVFCSYRDGQLYEQRLYQGHFKRGWHWLHARQDVSDTEWSMWRQYIWKAAPWFIGHSLLSYITAYLQPGERVWRSVVLLYDLAAVASHFSWSANVVFLTEAFLMYTFTYMNSVILVWIGGIILTMSLNMAWLWNLQEQLIQSHSFDSSLYLISSGFLHIRFISFGLEKAKMRQERALHQRNLLHQTENVDKVHEMKVGSVDYVVDSNKEELLLRDEEPNFLEVLSYAFYLPTFVFGPIIVFGDFHPQFKAFYQAKENKIHPVKIIYGLIRVFFWATFIEFALHFMRFTSLSFHPRILNSLEDWSLVGLVFCQGQFFMVKYVCFYGVGSVVSQCEGLIPPPLPRCISWVYSYTDMWKYFDTGLYKFIKKYIFVPLGGSRSGFLVTMLGSMACFAFIFYWHGNTWELFVWCLGNWFAGVLEGAVIRLNSSPMGVKLRSHLSPAMQLRIKALLVVFLYIFSSIMIMFFFFGDEVTAILYTKIFLPETWMGVIVLISAFYTNMHNAIYVADHYNCHRLKNQGD